MSNLPVPVPIVTTQNPIVDFSSKPAYLAHKSDVDNCFLNVLPINAYSQSLITAKINLSNALSQILDRVIFLDVPMKFTVTGSRTGAVGTPNLLGDGEFGVRSNAFLKCVNTSTVSVGTASSYSLQTDSGIVINFLEHSAPMYEGKQVNNIDNQLLDNVMDYDDVLYTSRSVLNLYSGNQGSVMGRAAYDIEVLSNTETQAELQVNFKLALFCAPLLQDVYVNGGHEGLSHIDALNITLSMTNLSTRLLSFARQTNNGVLNITNVQPIFGANVGGLPPPRLLFNTYNIISSNFDLPPSVNYKMPVIDRYSILAGVNRGSTATLSTPVITLNTVPSYVLLGVTYPESLYQSQSIQDGDVTVHATQLTDCFCPISQVNANVNSVNQLNNTTPATLWKMAVHNGSPKTFVEFSGRPLIKSLVGQGGTSYLYPNSAPCKFSFDKDLMVKDSSGITLSPGTNFKFNFSANFQVTNNLRYSDQVAVYLIFVYPSILSVSGVNNSVIVQSPISVEDNISISRSKPTAHYGNLNTHDLTGYGLMGKTHKLVSNASIAHRYRKHRMLRHHIKDMIGSMGGMSSGGAAAGGRRHRSHSRGKVSKAALRF